MQKHTPVNVRVYPECRSEVPRHFCLKDWREFCLGEPRGHFSGDCKEILKGRFHNSIAAVTELKLSLKSAHICDSKKHHCLMLQTQVYCDKLYFHRRKKSKQLCSSKIKLHPAFAAEASIGRVRPQRAHLKPQTQFFTDKIAAPRLFFLAKW